MLAHMSGTPGKPPMHAVLPHHRYRVLPEPDSLVGIDTELAHVGRAAGYPCRLALPG